jgi:hypothetical protein
MKKFITLGVTFTIFSMVSAQKNWDNIDFIKEYKVDTKMPGGVSKSLRNNPTFINDYSIQQASLMKGSSQAGVTQKQGVGSVFSEAALAGVSKEALQNLIDEMYVEFVEELKKAGLNITEGNDLMQTEYAASKASEKKVMIGKTDGVAIFEKVGGTDPHVYDTKERSIFRPKHKNIFITNAVPAGNFYQKLSTKENVNLISIGYYIKFADFEGAKTTSKNKLTTTAGLSIQPAIMVYNPAGLFSWITFTKAIGGNNDWSKGLVEKKSQDGSIFGLSSNADYAIHADEAKYIAELRSIISNLQKDLAQHIKSQL